MFVCVCLDIQACLEDVRMNASDSIDGMGPDDTQMSHVHSLPAFLLNQRHTPHAVMITGELACNTLKTPRQEGQKEAEGNRLHLCVRSTRDLLLQKSSRKTGLFHMLEFYT